MFLDCLDEALENPPTGALLAEGRVGDGREGQLLDLSAFLVEARTRFPALPFLPAVGPLKPSEPRPLSVEHHRQRTQAWPLLARSDQTFLHAVRKDVSNSPEQGLLIEHRLCRVAPFPEGSAPADDRADLLRDVRQKVLHELRDVAAWGSHEKVNVIRGKHECKKLDPSESCRPSQHAANYLVRPFGRTEEQTSLQAADGEKVRNCRLIHSQRSCQVNPPTNARSTNQANEVPDTSRGLPASVSPLRHGALVGGSTPGGGGIPGTKA